MEFNIKKKQVHIRMKNYGENIDYTMKIFHSFLISLFIYNVLSKLSEWVNYYPSEKLFNSKRSLKSTQFFATLGQ